MKKELNRALDEFYMRKAFDLAWTAAGRTEPNPLVGAVVVRGAEIISTGVHDKAGEAHAEIKAIEKAGELAEGATLYVNLEPCSHYGKTPPCVDRILESGIKRVVIATKDPNDLVNGSGMERLLSGGVQVDTGVLREKAILLNLNYFKKHLMSTSTITLKAAISIDGKLALSPGKRSSITSEAARKWAQELRALHRSVIVGIDTIMADEPELDCRLLEGISPPVPVVLDTHLRFPESYHWMENGRKFYLCTGRTINENKAELFAACGAKILQCSENNGGVDPGDVLARLSLEGIDTVLVEGGAKILSSFIAKGFWDAFYLLTGPKLFGLGGVSLFQSAHAAELNIIAVDAVCMGNDFIFSYLNEETRNSLVARLS